MELSQSLQESLLTLLCMDDRCSTIIRSSLPAASFEGTYGEIARAVYPYVDAHKTAPKANLDDVLESLLQKDDRKSRRVRRAMSMVKRTYESKLNSDYVLSRLDKRLRYHHIRTATRELLGVFNAGQEDDASIDQMEDILSRAVKSRVETFSPGTRLGDKKKVRQSLLRDHTEDVFPTGIRELDQHQLGPRRKQLHLLVGLKKVGKTRWLVNLGELAARQGDRVLHISLEMDEERMIRRYYQSFFGISEKRHTVRRKKFKKDEFGRLISIREKKSRVKIALDDKKAWKEISNRLDRRVNQLNNILIKSFPTRQLSFRELVAYLDRLEMQENFIPDLLIIDYPKLMRLNIDNFRLSHGALMEDLRGLGVERNMAVATVAQSHRMGKNKEGEVDSGDIGEDFSQMQTLDVGLVFRQSKMEANLGLARILVSDARDAPSGWEVLIAQNYDQGQFCVDSVRVNPSYWGILNRRAKQQSDEEDD